jgi:hypothetical protein
VHTLYGGEEEDATITENEEKKETEEVKEADA